MNKNKELVEWKKVDYSYKKRKIFSTKYFQIFKYQKIKTNKEKSLISFLKISIKYILMALVILIVIKFALSKTLFSKNRMNNNNGNKEHKYFDDYNITSDKWIVMTVFNHPKNLIINLEKNIANNWKIVVIGNVKTDDSKWDIFKNSNNLIYLSLKDQNKLGYNILQYLGENSYNRKNIGYLFAIKHGAKEIYEIDENLDIISTENYEFFDYNIKNSYICYGIENEQKMINPYVYFGETNIWPRGFSIKNILNDYNKTFYYAHSSQVKLRPLIYQGLINKIPDIDSIFLLSIGKIKDNLKIDFSKNFPLLYFPGNYVPINSKNTKYFYDIFPFLMLPITVNEYIADIIRGYIIERFVYGYGGTIIYNNSDIYNDNLYYNNSKFLEEREILFHLPEILEIINSDKYSENDPKKLFFYIIDELINKNLLKKEDKLIYNAFFDDLTNIGYIYQTNFTSNINRNYMDYLDIASELIFYIPPNPNILKRNNDSTLKIFKHSYFDKVYNDILLIINYNLPGFLKLNEYLEGLYKKYFPNIVYLYPSSKVNDNKNDSIIICGESYRGYYSYVCIEKIYKNYPNYKGYLLVNDDDYMKIWELENLDFNIPWFYRYESIAINPGWCFHYLCKDLYKICDNNLEWKKKVTKFFGMYKIFNGFADLYYVPNNYVPQFTELLKKMYDSKIFLECAVPTSFAIISAPKYQVLHIRPLWVQERERALNVLYEEFRQFSIHPIKFSNEELKIGVNKYNFFVNAIDY